MDRVEIAVGAVCEIGPAEVRRLDRGADELAPPNPVLTAAALDGDDPVVLVGPRPLAFHEVWRTLLEPLLCVQTPALLVHPSWWPGPRVDNVRAIARQLSGDVVTRPRSWLLAPIVGDAPVVEIGPQIATVTVDGAAPAGIQRRAATPSEVANSIVRIVLRMSSRGPVWIDASPGVPGAAALAGQVADRLRGTGRAVQWVDDRQLFGAATGLVTRSKEPRPQSRRNHHRLLVAATATATLTAVGISAGTGQDSSVATAPAQTTALVEGYVTMQIPADWPVRRITSGPGSARVEAISPNDGDAAIHLTQASVPHDSLAAAATTLRRAIDAEPAGVFADFDPADERAGRAAVTYREMRPGHVIRWAVVIDGDMRIGIGCQSGATSDDLTAACDEAVRSAHEID